MKLQVKPSENECRESLDSTDVECCIALWGCNAVFFVPIAPSTFFPLCTQLFFGFRCILIVRGISLEIGFCAQVIISCLLSRGPPATATPGLGGSGTPPWLKSIVSITNHHSRWISKMQNPKKYHRCNNSTSTHFPERNHINSLWEESVAWFSPSLFPWNVDFFPIQ